MTALERLTTTLRREGLLRTLDRGWERLWTRVGRWRLSHVLGRGRNLLVLPRLRRRAGGRVLHLGCGPDRRPGWINADLGLTGDVHLDVTRHFPFADETFALVFSEHLLEHLPEAGAEACLREACRVLQPGGILRVSTPDLAHFAAMYLAPLAVSHETRRLTAQASPWKYPPGAATTPAQMLNDAFHLWEHQHLYDETDLRALLERAGFGEITRHEPGQGGSLLTTGLERRLVAGTLVLEGRKPRE